jgi:hypothetical protein
MSRASAESRREASAIQAAIDNALAVANFARANVLQEVKELKDERKLQYRQ